MTVDEIKIIMSNTVEYVKEKLKSINTSEHIQQTIVKVIEDWPNQCLEFLNVHQSELSLLLSMSAEKIKATLLTECISYIECISYYTSNTDSSLLSKKERDDKLTECISRLIQSLVESLASDHSFQIELAKKVAQHEICGGSNYVSLKTLEDGIYKRADEQIKIYHSNSELTHKLKLIQLEKPNTLSFILEGISNCHGLIARINQHHYVVTHQHPAPSQTFLSSCSGYEEKPYYYTLLNQLEQYSADKNIEIEFIFIQMEGMERWCQYSIKSLKRKLPENVTIKSIKEINPNLVNSSYAICFSPAANNLYVVATDLDLCKYYDESDTRPKEAIYESVFQMQDAVVNSENVEVDEICRVDKGARAPGIKTH